MKKAILFLTIIIYSGSTLSSQTCFEYSATVCVPSDISIGEKSYKQTHGKVYHHENSIKPITLFGPLLNSITTNKKRDWWFKLYFNDNSPLNNNSTVSAVIKAVNKETGNISQLAPLSSANPNAPNTEYEGGIIQKMAFHLKDYSFDFENHFYYIQITITRTGIIHKADFFGYSLCEIAFKD